MNLLYSLAEVHCALAFIVVHLLILAMLLLSISGLGADPTLKTVACWTVVAWLPFDITVAFLLLQDLHNLKKASAREKEQTTTDLYCRH
jgi:hypothetical protein